MEWNKESKQLVSSNFDYMAVTVAMKAGYCRMSEQQQLLYELTIWRTVLAEMNIYVRNEQTWYRTCSK